MQHTTNCVDPTCSILSHQHQTRSFPETTVTRTESYLPREIQELPTAIHEHIHRERVEEVQPVINIEKFKTQVIHKVQPLVDREVRPVTIEERLDRSESLPDVIVRDVYVPREREFSTLEQMGTANLIIEKTPIYKEVDKLKVVEEIQPVIYKETIVPTIIKETKPIYQRVVEAPTHIIETMAPRELNQTHFRYPMNEVIPNQTLSSSPTRDFNTSYRSTGSMLPQPNTGFQPTNPPGNSPPSVTTSRQPTLTENPGVVSKHGFAPMDSSKPTVVLEHKEKTKTVSTVNRT